jgi:predicted nucleic acid-binding protein
VSGDALRPVVIDASSVLELRADLSAHDAVYVALAERLRKELLTADRALARAARAHTHLRVVAP